MLIEILEGWRGIFVFKKWKFQGRGVVGVWSGTLIPIFGSSFLF